MVLMNIFWKFEEVSFNKGMGVRICVYNAVLNMTS